MGNISIRTMMLVTFGVGLLAVLFTRGAPSVDAFHTILVLAFAIPGASWGYDRKPTSGSIVFGLCVWAVVGTVVLSSYILIRDFS